MEREEETGQFVGSTIARIRIRFLVPKSHLEFIQPLPMSSPPRIRSLLSAFPFLVRSKFSRPPTRGGRKSTAAATEIGSRPSLVSVLVFVGVAGAPRTRARARTRTNSGERVARGCCRRRGRRWTGATHHRVQRARNGRVKWTVGYAHVSYLICITTGDATAKARCKFGNVRNTDNRDGVSQDRQGQGRQGRQDRQDS